MRWEPLEQHSSKSCRHYPGRTVAREHIDSMHSQTILKCNLLELYINLLSHMSTTKSFTSFHKNVDHGRKVNFGHTEMVNIIHSLPREAQFFKY